MAKILKQHSAYGSMIIYIGKEDIQWNWKLMLFFNGSCHLIPKFSLTHQGQVTHMCISKLTISGSNNGLLPGRRQAII